MKKSDKTNRVEPTDTSWVEIFPDCATMFQRAGWFDFFQRIDGFNPEVSYGFSQGLDKTTASFDTLKFELTRELIVESKCIVDDGDFWFKKIPFTFNSKDFLLPEVKTLDWGKGVQLDNFKPDWREAIH